MDTAFTDLLGLGVTTPETPMVALHRGFAARQDGTVWRYDEGISKWKEATELTDAMNSTATLMGLWTSPTSSEAGAPVERRARGVR